MEWKRAQFNVMVNPRAWNGGNVDDGTRSGYTCGPFAIHSGTWTITHLPSGLNVCERATRFREAKEIAEQLLPLVDWSRTDPLQSVGEDTRQAVRAIVLNTA